MSTEIGSDEAMCLWLAALAGQTKLALQLEAWGWMRTLPPMTQEGFAPDLRGGPEGVG